MRPTDLVRAAGGAKSRPPRGVRPIRSDADCLKAVSNLEAAATPASRASVTVGHLHNRAIFQVSNVRISLSSDGQDRFCEPHPRDLSCIRVIVENPFDPYGCLIECL